MEQGHDSSLRRFGDPAQGWTLAWGPGTHYNLRAMSKKRALLFGLSIRTIVLGAGVLAVFFSGTLWALNTFLPRNTLDESKPATAELKPLQPVTRTSVMIAPVAVANLA